MKKFGHIKIRFLSCIFLCYSCHWDDRFGHIQLSALLLICTLHRKHFFFGAFGQQEVVQCKLAAVYFTVIPKVLHAFITSAILFWYSTLTIVYFPQSNYNFSQLPYLFDTQCLHHAFLPRILWLLCTHSRPCLTPGLLCQSSCQAPSVSPWRKAVGLCTYTCFEYLKPFCCSGKYYDINRILFFFSLSVFF